MPKVLHIEDDPANRLLVRKLLTPAGFEVADAADGLEGIRRAMGDRPALVRGASGTPGLDGCEATLRWRHTPARRGAPSVALPAEGNRETGIGVGCDGLLQTPIDARSCAATLQSYLDGQREAM